MGIKLTKVHRILKFNQRSWLKSYIDLNTTLRTAAQTDFEKDFYKLMNNSVFGKTMENIEKRVNVKLLTHLDENVFGYPKVNKKKLGFFQAENNGKIFREFVGLRSKMYAIDVENKFVAKAKGINKCVTRNMKME